MAPYLTASSASFIALLSLNILQLYYIKIQPPVALPTPSPSGELNPMSLELENALLKQLDTNSNSSREETEGPKIRHWAHSADGLQYLSEKEAGIYELMMNLEEELQERLKRISSWLDDYEQSTLVGTEHLINEAERAEEVASHPFMVLRMIRRFVNLEDQLVLGNRAAEEALVTYLSNMKADYALPGAEDYESAMENVVRLQYVYDLNIQDLLQGKIADVQTLVGLSQPMAHEIALYAEQNNLLTDSYFWLMTLLQQVQKSSGGGGGTQQPELDAAELERDLQRVKKTHDEKFGNLTRKNFWDFTHRFINKIRPGSRTIGNWTTLKQDALSYFPGRGSPFHEFTFERLCSTGASLLTELEKSKLICFYERKIDAYWLINPLKIEVYSWDPYLIRAYDVINGTVNEFLRKSAQPKMYAALVVNESYVESDPVLLRDYVEKSRKASTAFLDEEEDQAGMLEHVMIRIEQVTGLAVLNQQQYMFGDTAEYKVAPYASEIIQIASYPIGGHYEQHVDSLPESLHFFELVNGNRMATFMIYLNDVRLGGRTAFPIMGVTVEPIKNSAVLWFNSYKNGEPDRRTLHGGCPVLIGQKWIANTWIRSFASFQKRKCSLNPKE